MSHATENVRALQITNRDRRFPNSEWAGWIAVSVLSPRAIPTYARSHAPLPGRSHRALPFATPRLTLCASPRKLKVFSAYLLFRAVGWPVLREGFLSRFFRVGFGFGVRGVVVAAVWGCWRRCVWRTRTILITLDTSETLFAVLTAMNTCGYDVDLNVSDAQRLNIRAEVQRNLQGSEEAQAATETDVRVVCRRTRGRIRSMICRSMCRWRCICRGLRISAAR